MKLAPFTEVDYKAWEGLEKPHTEDNLLGILQLTRGASVEDAIVVIHRDGVQISLQDEETHYILKCTYEAGKLIIQSLHGMIDEPYLRNLGFYQW